MMTNPETIQFLADEFNKTYWAAAWESDSKKYFEACLIARQMIFELGQAGMLHDKLIDPEYTDKFTLEKATK